MRQRGVILSAAAVVMAGTLSGFAHMPTTTMASANVLESPCPEPEPDGTIDELDADGADAVSCDLVGVPVESFTGGSVEVPDIGEVTTLILDASAPGDSYEFAVAVADDGTIDAETVIASEISADQEESSGSSSAASVTGCEQLDYVTFAKKWYTNPISWKMNVGSVPDYLNTADAVNAIRSGATNIANTHNDCGLGDIMPRSFSYQGDTNLVAGINVNAAGDLVCANENGQNTVSFGNLGNANAAVCSYASPHAGRNSIYEFDMKWNDTANYFTFTPANPNCVGRIDMESTATHEFGHVVGLGHSGQSRLTMWGSSQNCSSHKRTLGHGDIRGLQALY